MNIHRIKDVLSKEHTLSESEWKGAVVFLCNEDSLFLIKRSEKMPTHGGQIAFVGGHKLSSEIDPWTVAQREFEEETHYSKECIEFLGLLPAVMTARMQPIVPVVAKLHMSSVDFLSEVKSNGEWDEILAYPWSELTQEKNWEFAWRHGFSKSAVMFHTIQSGKYSTVGMPSGPHLLWGATANMVWTFLNLYFEE